MRIGILACVLRIFTFCVIPLAAAGCAGSRLSAAGITPSGEFDRLPDEARTSQIEWLRYYEVLRASAGHPSRKLFLFFNRDSCEPCDMMEKWTFTDPDVLRALRDFIPVGVDGDVELQLVRRLKVQTFPMLVVLGPDETEIDRKAGYRDADFMLEWIKDIKANRGTMRALAEQLKQKPDDSELLLKQARNLLDANEIKAAIETAQKAAGATPGNPDVLAFFGYCYLRQRKLDAADAAATAALQIDPQNREAQRVKTAILLRRADDSFDKGDTTAAIENFSSVLEIDPESFEARMGMGKSYMKAGENERAAAQFQQAATLRPGSPAPHGALGDLRQQTGDDASAEAEYRKAIDLEPRYEMSYFRLMELYEKNDRRDELMKTFEKVVAIEPAGAHNEIAWLMATSKSHDILDPEAAIKHANQAVELQPHPWYIDTLAEAYYAHGDYDLAIAIIKEAIAKKPDDMQYYQGQLEKFRKAKEPATAAVPEKQ
ncbi:tetratricopeptide repeat protein [Candidatus Poribacteria bacterium]|nr:tetratricopeptide repeat protein [Candidatus Poribacteria bacterium]